MKPPPKHNPPNHLSDVPSHTVHHQCWGILTYNSSQAAAEEPPLCIGITNKLTKFLKPDELARNRASHKKNIANAILNNQDPDLDVAVQGFKFKAFGSTEYHQLKFENGKPYLPYQIAKVSGFTSVKNFANFVDPGGGATGPKYRQIMNNMLGIDRVGSFGGISDDSFVFLLGNVLAVKLDVADHPSNKKNKNIPNKPKKPTLEQQQQQQQQLMQTFNPLNYFLGPRETFLFASDYCSSVATYLGEELSNDFPNRFGKSAGNLRARMDYDARRNVDSAFNSLEKIGKVLCANLAEAKGMEIEEKKKRR